VPVLILDRFETVDSLDRRSFKARGKGVTLFEGLHYDLDSGQVVPDRMGGDVCVRSFMGGAEPGLRSGWGASRLYTWKPAVASKSGRLPDGRRAGERFWWRISRSL